MQLKKQMKKNRLIFIINSCIYYANKPLSYSPIRSKYTPKERLAQTYKTIDSIRSHCPNARIILIEDGINGDLLNELKTKVDEYAYIGNHFLVRLAVDSRWKGLGEVITLLLARKHLINKGNFFLKICGRYYLNDNFNLDLWNLNKFNFFNKNQVYSTRLYGFSNSLFNEWQKALFKAIPFLLLNQSIEYLLKKFINENKINYLKKLGIAGYIAPTGGFIEE